MTTSVLVIRKIAATSATLSEMMRSCMLRAGLSRVPDASAYVLGTPKAWLGTAYHAVLERIALANPPSSSLDALVDETWASSIRKAAATAGAHVLDRRFGAPETWPGYHVALASVRLRAQELLNANVPVGPRLGLSTADAPAPSASRYEERFVAFGGRLVGKPDVIRDATVIDYKTGAVTELDSTGAHEAAKPGYVRQLRIYAHLVKLATGQSPRKGVLLPLGGAGVEVALDPAECQREAEDSVALLDKYNQRVEDGQPVAAFASPSAETCRWCPYRVMCPPFWKSVQPSWSDLQDGVALEGPLTQDPLPAFAGAARALKVRVERGTIPAAETLATPFSSSTFLGVAQLSAPMRVRVTGARVRPDGVVVPTARTVLLPDSEWPLVSVGEGVSC